MPFSKAENGSFVSCTYQKLFKKYLLAFFSGMIGSYGSLVLYRHTLINDEDEEVLFYR